MNPIAINTILGNDIGHASGQYDQILGAMVISNEVREYVRATKMLPNLGHNLRLTCLSLVYETSNSSKVAKRFLPYPYLGRHFIVEVPMSDSEFPQHYRDPNLPKCIKGHNGNIHCSPPGRGYAWNALLEALGIKDDNQYNILIFKCKEVDLEEIIKYGYLFASRKEVD